MDFWDLTKLLFRRWYLTLPMLVLTAYASVWTLTNVQPNYTATAYVQLVPPRLQATPPGGASIDQRNPWFGLGLNSLANAAMVTVQDEAVVVALANGGYSETYTVALGSASPLVTFEIIGSSPAQASETADQLVQRYDQSVINLQRDYGVAQSDLIATRRLDLGTNVTESDSNVKRALVAVAGAGLLTTIAFTVGLDALIRRRARRNAGYATTDAPPLVGPMVPPVQRPAASRFDHLAVASNRPTQPETLPAARALPDLAGSTPFGTRDGSGGGPGVTVSFLPPPPAVARLTAPAEPASPAEEPTAVTEISPDETVVLPLSVSSTRRREKATSEDSQPK